MRRSDQRRDAVFALYQREVTGRPLAELLDRREAVHPRARRGRRRPPRRARPGDRPPRARLGRSTASPRSSAASCGSPCMRCDIETSPGRGRDRRGREPGEGVLRRRRARVRQRDPRRAARRSRRRAVTERSGRRSGRRARQRAGRRPGRRGAGTGRATARGRGAAARSRGRRRAGGGARARGGGARQPRGQRDRRERCARPTPTRG